MYSDLCRICKSSRYLSPDLKFLVNPECYHKICGNCVDRIFSMGPAQCPYEGCEKILRKNKFKEQVFEDLGVEREVDVRQRVSKTFNKRQEDFETLKEFNNYLEEVENMIFNLVNKVDVESTEKKLQAYEQKNKELIMANTRRQQFDDEQIELRNKYEKERKQKSMQLEIEMSRAEKEIREEEQKDYLRELSMSNIDPGVLKRRMDQTVIKKLAEKRKKLEAILLMPPPPSSGFRGFMGFDGKGGRNGAENSGAETPFTPFMGDYEKEPLFEIKNDYLDPVLDMVKEDPRCIASGYRLDKAYQLDLIQAFFGLGCYIGKEKVM